MGHTKPKCRYCAMIAMVCASVISFTSSVSIGTFLNYLGNIIQAPVEPRAWLACERVNLSDWQRRQHDPQD